MKDTKMRKPVFSTILSAGIATALLILCAIAFADTGVTTGVPAGSMGTGLNTNFEAGRWMVLGDVTWDDAWHEYKLYTFLALLIIMIIAWWWSSKDR